MGSSRRYKMNTQQVDYILSFSYYFNLSENYINYRLALLFYYYMLIITITTYQHSYS